MILVNRLHHNITNVLFYFLVAFLTSVQGKKKNLQLIFFC